MRWTETELEEYQAMRAYKARGKSDHDADPGPESRLQSKIIKWAKDKGYPCQANRQSRKAAGFIIPGWPDITLILPAGRVLFVELKGGKGRLSKDQIHLALQFQALGHEIHEVRSYKKFIEIIEVEK